jgi:uncharacterized pyridoxal phosphate-containing UPF0001 family protein
MYDPSEHKQRRPYLSINLKILESNFQFSLKYFQEKSGVDPGSVSELYKQIVDNCKHLELIGLMTIGSLGESLNKNEKNNDFQVLEKAVLLNISLSVNF